jgi:hypothetical protein
MKEAVMSNLRENEAADEARASIEEMMKLYEELSFRQKWHKVSLGLQQPEYSGEYKWARLQVTRLSALALAVIVPLLVVFLLTVMLVAAPLLNVDHVVTVYVPEPMPEPIEKKPEDIKKEIVQLEDIAQQDVVDRETIKESINKENNQEDAVEPVTGFSQMPPAFDSVPYVKSPMIFRNMMENRNPANRRKIISRNRNGSDTEDAVDKALRWLKKNQASDGSWPRTKPAMTGLALLAFFAHGETPASEEFGLTVESALKWMLENQEESGNFKGRDPHDYSHPIAAYALSEGYAMTLIPELKYAAEKAIAVIVKGQQASGGWDYNCKASSTRNDTSYAGWCAQALKAATIAGLEVDGLDQSCKKALDGFRSNAKGDYDLCGFGYTAPGQGGLTAVGALCMQLLGAGNANEVSGSLKLMDTDKWAFKLVDPPIGKSGLYYFYYATQAKYYAGGATWDKWDAQFAPELVKGQIVISKDKSGYCDHKNQPRSIGYWDQYPGHGNNENPVFSTLLGVLQLEVYYRYSPTHKEMKGDDVVAAMVPGNNKEAQAEISIHF